MLLESLNWKDVEEYLKCDTRIVLVLGATEEHADLSLCTDTIIPYSIAKKACEIENVILLPALPYGISTWSIEYPGTVTLKTSTMINVVNDIIESILYSGFKKIFVLNGHGFNRAVAPVIGEAISKTDGAEAVFLQWYDLPSLKKAAEKADSKPEHANWAENFNFTNIKQKQREITNIISTMPSLLKDGKSIRKELKDGHGSGLLEIDKQTMDLLFEDLVNDFINVLRTAGQ